MDYTENRMQFVKKFYDAISNFDISLPTPIMSGLRTNTRQFSSCVVLNVGDSLDSIGSGNQAILKYISKKAGLGINYGRVRAVGSEIRGGDAVHTGLIPFLSAVAKTVKSCSQGGVRGGAATVHFPLWHLEFEDLVVNIVIYDHYYYGQNQFCDDRFACENCEPVQERRKQRAIE